jgi:hypothetical protein
MHGEFYDSSDRGAYLPRRREPDTARSYVLRYPGVLRRTS